jgi:hypothetical protein
MMQYTAYRLGEYKIIEDEHGDLWRETHIGLGSSKSGECFINGDILLFWKSPSGLGSLKVGRCHIKGSILFLEPGKTELSSPKKREFIQQLICLPDWRRTKYFCTNYAIYYSKTGAICRRLGDEKDLK